MDRNDFERLQQVQVEIYDEIARICEINHIQYFAIGGTAIGTVRHHGFIPWDFDIDIAMVRDQYDLFKECCKTQLDDRFRYIDYTTMHNYIRPHAVIGIRNTVLYTKYDKYNKHKTELGIYVDIMPFDNVPDNPEERKTHERKIKRIREKIGYVKQDCYDASIIKKVLKFLRALPFMYRSLDSYNALLDKEMRKYNGTNTEYLSCMAGKYTYEREMIKRSYIGTPIKMKFEDREMYVPEDFDSYLNHVYGDYMKLPPEEEQVANLSYFDEVLFDR